MKKLTFKRRRFAVFRCAQNVVDDVGFPPCNSIKRFDLLTQLLQERLQELIQLCFITKNVHCRFKINILF
jgi:hypothetical protein